MVKHTTYRLGFLVFLLLSSIAAGVAAASKPTLLVLGDSLSAAYGIEQKAGWITLLQERLRERHSPYQVVNASISGETTSGGLARLGRALEKYRPSIIIVELGGNDGLRGLPLSKLRDNLAAIIEQCLSYDARVLLVGMRLPPNYGPAYTKRFHQTYFDLARQYQVPLVPFLLEGVAGKSELMQADSVHPRAEAQARVLDNVWGVLQPMLPPSSQGSSIIIKNAGSPG